MGEYFQYLAKAFCFLMLGLFGLMVATSSIAGAFSLPGLLLGAASIAAAWYGWPRRPHAWKSDPPTDKQLAYAADLGIVVPPGATKGEVSAMITAITGR